MKLFDLAYACRLFGGSTDRHYIAVRDQLGDDANLQSEAEQDSLLAFLNNWGCRIPRRNFQRLKTKLQGWAGNWAAALPSSSTDIRSLGNEERRNVGAAYGALLEAGAGLKFRDTAAAKTMHVLRPHVLPAWDEPIRTNFQAAVGAKLGAELYADFISRVAAEIAELELDASRLGFALANVPTIVGHPKASIVKLADEYLWTTITLGYRVPNRKEIETWLTWSV